MHEASDNRSTMDHVSRQPMIIVGQLFKIITAMHDVDELFQWITSMIVQRLNAPIVHLWAKQAGDPNQFPIELHALVRQDKSVPRQVTVNEQVASVAQLMAGNRVDYTPARQVEGAFSRYQASLLKRYGLHYFAACFASSETLTPPQNYALPYEKPPVPLEVVVLLFFRNAPHTDLVPGVRGILEQSLVAAEKHGLLSATNQLRLPPVHELSLQEQISWLRGLIPCRKQESVSMLTSSPFSKLAIKDKQARRLYGAIDNHTNVDGLCKATGLEMKEVYAALQSLLTRRYIELCGPDGQPVDASLLLGGQ